jgi:3-oxoadipate enol-lactonase
MTAAQPRQVPTRTIEMTVVEAGRGRPLVFLHGLGWDHTLWSRQVARYAGTWRVIAGDTRGHGGSAKPAGPYTLELFADDWAALLDALAVRDACLVGFSQGGMIAMQLAIARPDLVGALVLVSTSCRAHASGRANMEARIAAMRAEGPEAAARVGAASVFSPTFRAANPQRIEAFVAWRAAMAQEPLVAAMRAATNFDVRAGLATVAKPCLVIAGTADTLTRPDAVAEVAATIPGARYKTVEGAGHMIPVEQPEAFDRLLDAFLAQHFPASRLVATPLA